MSQDAGTYMVGDVRAFTWQPQIDAGSGYGPWDLTGGTVTFYLRDPSGVVTSHAASIVTLNSIVSAQYVTTTSDLASAGTWERWWKGVVAGVQETQPPITFTVGAAP